ncbi:FG-GAP-like repeat-containing protein [Rhodosalinus sp. FB01]|uniref:FG-GAP-like repeat-containing protein n=1 Tax=Rhodosalinus sp. FB01 TaxID=3239194 RepID=UPI003525D7FE
MRLAAALACLAAAGCAAADGGPAGDIASARYEVSLDTYPHRIMGSIREKAVLAVTTTDGRTLRIDLRDGPEPDHVFEDTAPRVADADGDGAADVIVVETDPQLGAQLAVYSLRQGALVKAHATPHIGTRFRWLAPAGIADLNGDGVTDIAYVDRPHLVRTLRVWSWAAGGLTEIAALEGLTNHRIGDEVISGGIRDCGQGPEIVLADAGWRRLRAVTLADGRLAARDIGPLADGTSFAAALACETG